jgi:hypothetical protein
LFAAGCEQGAGTGQPPATGKSSSSGPGEAPPQPEITLEVVDLNGYEQLVKKHRGKVVFVDIWATW